MPFVVVFATPEFCLSRVCGPTVEVVQKVADKFAGSKLRFIHVEIYKETTPRTATTSGWASGICRPSPGSSSWTDQGVIRGRFEGAVSVPELTEGVSKDLEVAPTR